MIVISSHNGLEAARCGYRVLDGDGTPVDAAVEAVTVLEDDVNDLTVGYGGLPNEQGIVELDAAVMDGATHRSGAVAGLRNVRHAARVAKLVMQRTNRCLLVGEGAAEFARANGFQQEDLLTEQSRRMWLYWKRRRSPIDDWVAADDDQELDLQRWYDKHFKAPQGPEKNGTVFAAALDDNGNLAAATSTSGHAFKISGRVGDSPVVGAGLYVDNEVGACGSIGHGEANMQNCSSFLVVELMRQGASPQEAGLEALRRISQRTPIDQCDEHGRPRFHLQLFVLAKDGRHAGVAMWDRRLIAVADQNGSRLEDCRPLHKTGNNA